MSMIFTPWLRLFERRIREFSLAFTLTLAAALLMCAVKLQHSVTHLRMVAGTLKLLWPYGETAKATMNCLVPVEDAAN